MKTKEFIRRVIDLNPCWQVHGNGSGIAVFNELDYKIAEVSQTEVGTYKVWGYKIDDFYQYAFDNLVSDFALTPLAEREDEKKYYVVVSGDIDKKYFNYATSTEDWIVGSNWETGGFQTIFTQSELDELKQRDDIPIDWSKVKLVEVDDDE